jgi:hypothetical protein
VVVKQLDSDIDSTVVLQKKNLVMMMVVMMMVVMIMRVFFLHLFLEAILNSLHEIFFFLISLLQE